MMGNNIKPDVAPEYYMLYADTDGSDYFVIPLIDKKDPVAYFEKIKATGELEIRHGRGTMIITFSWVSLVKSVDGGGFSFVLDALGRDQEGKLKEGVNKEDIKTLPDYGVKILDEERYVSHKILSDPITGVRTKMTPCKCGVD